MLNDFYDESEPLVKLEMFYGPKKHIVDKCIVMFSLPIHDYILKNYECTKIAEIGGSNGNVPVWSF